MVKTPKRRQQEQDEEENGEAPETPKDHTTTTDSIIMASPPASRLRSRKRTRRDDDDDDDSIATTDDDENVTRPPAAKRRSTRTRKKKEDEDDSSMASTTDHDDEATTRRRRHRKTTTRKSTTRANGRKKTHHDESMTEEESGMEDTDTDAPFSMEKDTAKPSGQNNGYKSTMAVASLPTLPETEEETHDTTNGSSKPAALGPISKLRMPSKHTPGKLQTTAPGRRTMASNVLNELPPIVTGLSNSTTTTMTQQEQEPVKSPPGVGNDELAAILVQGCQESPQQQQKQEEEEVSLTAHWYQVATTSLGTMVLTIGEVATSLVVPQMEQYAEGEEEEDIEVPVSKPLLTRTYVWFILLLLLQYVCREPLVTAVEDASNRSLDFYQSIFGMSNTVEQVAPPTAEQAVLPSMSDDKVKQIDELSELLESLKLGSKIDGEMTFVERKLLEIRGRMKERKQALQDWQDGLDDVELALQGLATATNSMDDVPRLFLRANEILGFFKDMVPPTLSTEILDTTYIFMWETVATTECTQPTDTLDDPVLTMEMLQMGQDELRQMSLLSDTEIMSNDDVSRSLRVWVRDALPEETTTSQSQEEDEKTLSNVLTQDMARGVIAHVLEKERADQLGVVDYASILAGSSVIERATSPSLVDSLPLWNRLMVNARLRFYGYGPEAALTPTFPVNALGQCWAFERNPNTKGGRYANLTVRLGKPIHVTRVAVEHAPKELTDQPETAIREFRIIGFEDADATGEAFPLGSFQYDIDARRTLQEFEVANHANDELIPKLRSVALAIDSNWGANHSCLYRFRVLGGDEPSERVIVAITDSDGSDDIGSSNTKTAEDKSEDRDTLHEQVDDEVGAEAHARSEKGATPESEEPGELDSPHEDRASEVDDAAEKLEEAAERGTRENAEEPTDSVSSETSDTKGGSVSLDESDKEHGKGDSDHADENAERSIDDVDLGHEDEHEEIHNWDNENSDSGDSLHEDRDSGDREDGSGNDHQLDDDRRDDSHDENVDSGEHSLYENHDSGDDSGDEEHDSGDDDENDSGDDENYDDGDTDEHHDQDARHAD